MIRVDSVSVAITTYQEFEGSHVINFTFAPAADDPLLAALLARNEQILMAAVREHPADDIFIG